MKAVARASADRDGASQGMQKAKSNGKKKKKGGEEEISDEASSTGEGQRGPRKLKGAGGLG